MWSWEGSGRLPNFLRREVRGELEEKVSVPLSVLVYST